MKRTLIALLCIVGLTLGASACTPRGSSRGAIQQYFPEQYDKAVRVVNCESGMNPDAVSPTSDYGLFQINKVHRPMVERMGYSWSQIFDPYVNSRVARVIYDDAARRGNGWSPWTCRYA